MDSPLANDALTGGSETISLLVTWILVSPTVIIVPWVKFRNLELVVGR